MKYFPSSLLEYWFERSSNPRFQRVRQTRAVATAQAKDMVAEKAEYLLRGKGSKDIFTLLGKFQKLCRLNQGIRITNSQGKHGCRSKEQAQ